MSSNMRIQKVCAECGQEFIAKTTVTRCCSDRCAKLLYKRRKRSQLLQEAIEVHRRQTIQAVKNEQSKRVRKHDATRISLDERRLLNTMQMAFVLGIGKRTLQRLLPDKDLPRLTIGKRILFEKHDVLVISLKKIKNNERQTSREAQKERKECIIHRLLSPGMESAKAKIHPAFEREQK